MSPKKSCKLSDWRALSLRNKKLTNGQHYKILYLPLVLIPLHELPAAMGNAVDNVESSR